MVRNRYQLVATQTCYECASNMSITITF